MLVSNEGLRREIQAWVRSVGLDLDDLADAAYRSTDASSACVELGRSGVSTGASALGCAGQGSGVPCLQHAAYSPTKCPGTSLHVLWCLHGAAKCMCICLHPFLAYVSYPHVWSHPQFWHRLLRNCCGFWY